MALLLIQRRPPPPPSQNLAGGEALTLLEAGSLSIVQPPTNVSVADGDALTGTENGAALFATKLVMVTQPAGAVSAQAFSTQPSVRLQSAASVNVSQAGVLCTATIASGAGTLIGTATATTDASGIATWATLGISATAPPSDFTLTFSANGFTSTTSSSFSVAAIGSPTILFHSDWSTATGTTAAAIRDTGKVIPWSTFDIGNASIQTIVSAAGRGFPAAMANVMRISHEVADEYNWVIANQLWTLPAVGEARANRLYFRHEIPDANGTQSGWAAEHPLETEGGSGGVSGNFAAWHYGSNADGTFVFSFATSKAFPYNYLSFGSAGGGSPATLSKFVTYRFEWKWTRTGTGLYTLEFRVYGADDSTLLYSNANVYGWGGGTLATGTNSQNYPMDDARMRSVRIGDNGGIAGGTGAYVYVGGYCVADDWCGPYTAAG